jgi:uncharacterized protein
MSVEVRDNPEQERYEATLDGALAGFIQYRLSENRITMYHTEVDPQFEGHGVGSALARGALGDVRTRGLELIPTCPFVAAFIRSHPDEYLDLVVPAMREKVIAGG